MNVAPWELLEQPAIWREWALAAEQAENGAEKSHQQARERQQGGGFVGGN